MFNLSRYFLTLSFVLVVLAAGVLGPLYRNLSLQQMNELAEARNLAMATVYDNAYRQKLNDLLLASSGLDAAQLRESAGDSGQPGDHKHAEQIQLLAHAPRGTTDGEHERSGQIHRVEEHPGTLQRLPSAAEPPSAKWEPA